MALRAISTYLITMLNDIKISQIDSQYRVQRTVQVKYIQ